MHIWLWPRRRRGSTCRSLMVDVSRLIRKAQKLAAELKKLQAAPLVEAAVAEAGPAKGAWAMARCEVPKCPYLHMNHVHCGVRPCNELSTSFLNSTVAGDLNVCRTHSELIYQLELERANQEEEERAKNGTLWPEEKRRRAAAGRA